MIGIEGQFLFSISVPGCEDFIAPMDLTSFTIIEDCGNLLPTFEVEFTMGSDNKAIEFLNEGNDLTIRMGRTSSSMVEGKYIINKSDKDSSKEGKRSVYINGIYAALPYLQNGETKIYEKKKSIDVVKEIGQKHFQKVDCTADTDDEMNWSQTGCSDKVMVNQTLLHSWIPNGQSSVCVGITMEGEMRLYDLKKAMSSPKYTFGQGGITYDTDYTITENSTYNNSVAGNGRYKVADNVDTGMTDVAMSSTTPMGDNQSPLKRADVKPKSSTSSFMNENVHKNYNNAEVSNRSNLMTMGNVKLEFTFPNAWTPIKVLDCIKFSEYTHSQNGSTNLNISGNYLVTKVARTIHNNVLQTVVQCSKDSLSEVKGNFGSVLGGVSNLGGIFSSSMNSMGNLSSLASQVGQVNNVMGQLNSAAGSVPGGATGIMNAMGGGMSLDSIPGIGNMMSNISPELMTNMSNLISMNPTSLAAIVPMSDITNKIGSFSNFDTGGLLDNSLMSNIGDLLGGGFSLGNMSGIGQNVMGFLGIDIGGMFGSLFGSYRIPFDGMLTSALSQMVMSKVNIPGISQLSGAFGGKFAGDGGSGGMSKMRMANTLEPNLEDLRGKFSGALEDNSQSERKNLFYERFKNGVMQSNSDSE